MIFFFNGICLEDAECCGREAAKYESFHKGERRITEYMKDYSQRVQMQLFCILEVTVAFLHDRVCARRDKVKVA